MGGTKSQKSHRAQKLHQAHKLTRHHAKQFLHRISKVRTWQFILVLIPLLFLTVTFFRFDHLHMDDLRHAVITADEAADETGDEVALSQALAELQSFTFSHTVFSAVEDNGIQTLVLGTGPFYLQHQYDRAAEAAIAEAESKIVDDSNPNGNIYAAAASVCQPIAKANGWHWYEQPYLDCMTGELAKYPTTDALETVTATIPSPELYRYNYASPIWAPSLSGFATILCLLLIVVIFIRFLIWFIVRIGMLFLK